MPGILFASGQSSLNLDYALHGLSDSGYSLQTFEVQNDAFYCSAYTYAAYPLQILRSDGRLIIFEGMVYPVLDQNKTNLFDLFFDNNGWKHDEIAKWVRKTDGEFVFLLYNPHLNEVLIVNDRFGRLPLYVSKVGEAWIISREIRFVTALNQKFETDPIGNAQQLLFGFPLGKRTLWKGVDRCPPYAQIHISLTSCELTLTSSFVLPKTEEHKPTPQKISDILALLQVALNDRLEAHSNLALSLSGGLDSRLIAGLLSELNVELPLLTYDDAAGSAKADIEAVKMIVNQLNFQSMHQVIQVPSIEKKLLHQLATIKQGLNGLDMAFILPFLEYFEKKELVQLTGDGGDKVLADLRPLVRIYSMEQLIKYLLRKHALFSPETVAKLTGLDVKTIIQSIEEVLNAYPTSSISEKHVYFMVCERAMKWLFEGEDRNRYFAWATTPFYQPAFFEWVMGIPMEQKANGKLFLRLFEQLPGNLETIINPNWNAALSNQNTIKRLYLKQKLQLMLPEKIVKSLKPEAKLLSFSEFTQHDFIELKIKKLASNHHLKLLHTMQFTYDQWFRIANLIAGEVK